ncbi:MAG TPA: (d)CMP kinase [Candidatus Eisenbacteria bacterium]|nr:(d)CMP kinase [Candidatus Eisenbacteria bacterium]
MIIAIDGPSGAGKSTLAKRLARDLGFTYLDTGAMYRALALKILRTGTDLSDERAVEALVRDTAISVFDEDGTLRVLLDGIDVSRAIRTPEVSQMASKASALRPVRARMLELQREAARQRNVVAEGRDIGTVVFPHAEVKIFLDASVAERARRRFEELCAGGRQVTFEETLREIEERDRRDTERALAPLCKAPDAVTIDNSFLNANQVAERALAEVRKRWM